MDTQQKIKEAHLSLKVAPEQTPPLRLQDLPNLFNWSQERKNEVIEASRQNLETFLADAKLDRGTQQQVAMLWRDVVGVFQNGGHIVVNDKDIGYFSPNALPTHSEYHVSKVMTLVEKLYPRAIPEQYQNKENALALALSVIIHDIGSLQGAERGPQERFYSDHEERSIAIAQKILTSLTVNDPTINTDRLRDKVTFLIASTPMTLDLDFSPTATADTVPIVQVIRGQKDIETTMTTPGIKRVLGETLAKIDDKKELEALTSLMDAADHGTYLFEPCRTGEVIGLWQELNTMWEAKQPDDAKVNDIALNRRAPAAQKLAREYLASNFYTMQLTAYGHIYDHLDHNPFVPSRTVAQTVEAIAETNKHLTEPVAHDPLQRFEGFFSPIQLEEISKTLDVYDNQIVKTRLKLFSQKFSAGIHSAAEFNVLATQVLATIHRFSEEQAFFKATLGMIEAHKATELTTEGTYNLHIAPLTLAEDAKPETLRALLSNLAATAFDSPDKKIDKIFLTIRERKDEVENIGRLKEAIAGLDESVRERFGISLGGKPDDDTWFGAAVANLGDTPAAFHLGLEDSKERMLDRITTMFAAPEGSTIHLSDNIGTFIDCYEELLTKAPQAAEKLKAMLTSVSPLGYAMLGGENSAKKLELFARIFPDAKAAANNTNLLGDLGVQVQQTCLRAASPSV